MTHYRRILLLALLFCQCALAQWWFRGLKLGTIPLMTPDTAAAGTRGTRALASHEPAHTTATAHNTTATTTLASISTGVDWAPYFISTCARALSA